MPRRQLKRSPGRSRDLRRKKSLTRRKRRSLGRSQDLRRSRDPRRKRSLRRRKRRSRRAGEESGAVKMTEALLYNYYSRMIVTNSSNTSTRRKRRKTGSQWVMRFPFIRARMKICGSSTQEYQDILIIKYQHFPCFNHILRLIGSLRRELNRRRIIRNVFWCPRIQEMFYRSHARHLQSSTIRNHQKRILTVFSG